MVPTGQRTNPHEPEARRAGIFGDRPHFSHPARAGPTMTMTKTSTGNYFEDFRIGQLIAHATPRTVSAGDVALYNGLFGPRFAVQSSDAFAQKIGYPRAPVDDLLVFHRSEEHTSELQS